MAIRDLTFRLIGKDQSAGKTFTKVGKDADRLQSRFAGMAGALAGGAIGAGIVAFGKASASAFKEAEEAQKKLEFAFSKFPKLADTNIEALRGLNTELARKTKYDDDAIASGQAVLAQFNLTGKQIAAVTPLLLDYADATGKDIPGAGMDLGKALLGNAKALKNVGIAYKATGDAGKDFENIQALLTAKVGGFAEEEGKTAAGQAAILKNRYGELQEEVGRKLVPILAKLAEKLLEVIEFVERNSAVIIPLAAGIATVVAGVKAWTTAQAILNSTLWANPIGLVVIALAALAVGLTIAYKRSETFRNIVQGAFRVTADVVLAMVEGMLQTVRLFAKVSDTVFGTNFTPAIDRAIGKVEALNNKIQGLPATKTVTIYAKTSLQGEAALNGLLGVGPRPPVVTNPGTTTQFLQDLTGRGVSRREAPQVNVNVRTDANPQQIGREVGRQVRFAQ